MAHDHVAEPFRSILSRIVKGLEPADSPEPRWVPKCHYRHADLRTYRELERRTAEELAAEFSEAGYEIGPTQIQWAVQEYHRRLKRAVGR